MIQPDAATNSLIITAPEPLYRNLRATIEKLDVRRAQVVIESLIVEVSADKAAEFGVQFQALGGLRETNANDTSVIGGTNFGARGGGTNIIDAAQNLASLGTGLNIGVIRGRVTIPGIGEVTNLGLLARALETRANANVLSRPNIQTLDNEEAKFLVGQNVPFQTGSFTQGATGATNPFQTFERRDIGTQLRVRPQISEGGAVRLSIYLEVSSIAPTTVQGQIVTNKRSFESAVIVDDGNFVVLSGLIEDRSSDSQSKVPLLGDLPLIGGLFRYDNRSRTKTNTMIFLRPYVIRDERASSTLAADRYEFMRAQMVDSQRPDTLLFRGYQIDLPPPANVPPPAAAPAPPSAPPAPTSAPAPESAAPPGVSTAQSDAAPTTAPVAQPAPVPATGAFAAAPGAAAPAGAIQLIQVIALSELGRARELQRQLRAAGFDAYWESVRLPNGKGEVVRVRVAVDRTRQSVAETIAELKRRGFEPTLVNP
jgi:general secretion pathway protein D